MVCGATKINPFSGNMYLGMPKVEKSIGGYDTCLDRLFNRCFHCFGSDAVGNQRYLSVLGRIVTTYDFLWGGIQCIIDFFISLSTKTMEYTENDFYYNSSLSWYYDRDLFKSILDEVGC